jgi:hypothetical protein
MVLAHALCSLTYSLAPKIDEMFSSKMSVDFHWTLRNYISEGRTLQAFSYYNYAIIVVSLKILEIYY